MRLREGEREYRRAARPDPLRVVVSSQGKLDAHLQLFQRQLAPRTCALIGETGEADQLRRLRERGVHVIEAPVDQAGRVDLVAALRLLVQQGVMHLLIEGGSSLLGSAFERRLIDHVAVFVAQQAIGEHRGRQLSASTLLCHIALSAAMRKWGARRRIEAARMAEQKGWL
ncbi:MAG TPA: dihydrofolate reductase family protein [Ktedonobacteraceae bacterium]|nr:dihydrofolate reductase family protein [Ktedonobacteraceae bacterium]